MAQLVDAHKSRGHADNPVDDDEEDDGDGAEDDGAAPSEDDQCKCAATSMSSSDWSPFKNRGRVSPCAASRCNS
jgi:hypothetical protein